MNARTTLILVGLFAVLLGYVYFFELNKTPAQLGTPTPVEPVVFNLNAADVKSIEVRDLQGSREVKVTRAGNGWQVDLPEYKTADSSSVDTALSAVVDLQATRVLTDITNLTQFFVTPTIEARFIMSGTNSYAITVGDQTPDRSNYYVTYTGDKSKVFTVGTSAIDSLKAWLDTPPYQPTPTPTFTATPPETPSAAVTATETISVTLPEKAPEIIPTLIPATETPKP
ncbi:MAG: DUF4340 domain-containing protein [Chloroflexi bacterium]|nr:DUF4340 domain-containing protein [Chloroflexota bacterium]